jgi:hypothetical protein
MEEWRHNTHPVDVQLNDKQNNLHDPQHDDIKRINKQNATHTIMTCSITINKIQHSA